MFINYNPQTGYSVKTYRNNGIYCTITELVQEIHNGNECSCDFEDALDAINDGSLWQDEDQEILEMIDSAINEH